MKEYRSRSQISFGFLPEQTVDLKGKVWKVKEWTDAKLRSVEVEALRQELARQVMPWATVGKDGKYLERIRSGYAVRLVSLNRETGVSVEKFPQSWLCKACNRLFQNREPDVCNCGNKRFGQLPFVGYHDDCGSIRTPYISPCPTHKQLKCIFPGTARAEEIRFICPVCNREIQRGFGFRKCACGKGRMKFNVHRAASVYTPRSIVMINPASTEQIQRIRDAGGPNRALAWVLSGLKAANFDDLELTEESLRASLKNQGIPQDIIEQMIETAQKGGAISSSISPVKLEDDILCEAEATATNIALALADSRMTIGNLADAAYSKSDLGKRYRFNYLLALENARLESIEFVDRFPVLTGSFGYTRGEFEPGASQLVPFRNSKGEYVIHGDVTQTEALLIRMEPQLIAKWLTQLGHHLSPWSDARSARISILEACRVPQPWDNSAPELAGTKLLTLVHSYSHWLIRRLAVYSGVERSALSEFLVPQHGAFFVYASGRGDFVLGGLQAVFESDLDVFLKDLAQSDLRCPLDPGCQHAGGACMACLHLGEPSCRYFNRYLSRQALMSGAGYLTQSL